ncbi:MAG: DUF4011 domain-containing protein [Candidatus Bruticola sp.]
MNSKKLEKWANLLLDTGKRNNLINFKDSKFASVEVLLPSSDLILEKIEGNTQFSVFDPKINDDEELSEGSSLSGTQSVAQESDFDARNSYLAKYGQRLKTQKQLLLYNSGSNPITALKNISKKSKEFIEETGVNVAHMAFGFIHWKESEASQYVYSAPVLLMPILLEQDSVTAPFYIRSAGDDIIVNPTFSYKLEAEYGIKIPEYGDENLNDYLAQLGSLLKGLKWQVSAECKIGIFSFLKINMYQDLKENSEAILANDNVRALLGEGGSAHNFSGMTTDYKRVDDPLIELHSVVDADSSQIEAIEMAKSGKSFVLQGPPGTGKSQTITNIIAECLSDGKKVLFVSEKQAALRVVYDKLKQAGLAEFCLELHSHKANKKSIIEDLCHTLRMSKSTVSARADSEIALKKQSLRQLDAYAAELHKQRGIINKSLYQLYESFSALRHAPEIEWAVPQIELKNENFLHEANSLISQYTCFVPSAGYNYKENPWYGYLNQDNSYQNKLQLKKNLEAVIKFLDDTADLAEEISRKYGVACHNIQELCAWRKLFSLWSDSNIVTPKLLQKNRIEQVEARVDELKQRSAAAAALKAELEQTFTEKIYELDGSAYKSKLSDRFRNFWSRLFSWEYWKIAKDVRQRRKDGQRLSYNQIVELMGKLAEKQQQEAAFAQVESAIKDWLGGAYQGLQTDWDVVGPQLDQLHSLAEMVEDFGKFAELTDSALQAEKETLKDVAENLGRYADPVQNQLLELCRNFSVETANLQTLNREEVRRKLSCCLSEFNKLENWCSLRSLLLELQNKGILPFVDTAIESGIQADQFAKAFERQFYNQWIYCILAANPIFASFNRAAQDRAIELFKEKDPEQFEINKASIRAVLSAQRPALDLMASGSASAILLREGEKKRRQKGIRTLLSETGELVQRLKPCFLMSPLSVSTFLAPGAVTFDTVVFDEASQIFPQDAVGAIYRGKQLIVVGDSKQMPPSNFFNASIEESDSDEESGDITDFESVLDLCSASMPQLRLSWHYRSRCEQLIAFSNKNFYDNSLTTFPSAKADSLWYGVDYYYAGGVFDRRSHTNRQEAEVVVDLIYKNIEVCPERSLGVVAFSVAQQELIDRLLARRRQQNPDKEYFFRNDAKEPFFIKNLETVQGDERDTIIFSVAYGKDAQGRLLHNFGPLNRVGGGRRLNVAVTRAKYNVQLVSSMHYTDIDLTRTGAEGARLLREYLDLAENGTVALERAVSVNQFEQFDSDFELEVCEYLRSKGFSVDTQVGCSGFRIDLGLKKPESSDYVLAIECDGASYHSSKNARDRDRLRQEILERMGWKFYRIWSTDWFKNKAVEQERLLKAAAEAIKGAAQPQAAPVATETQGEPAVEYCEEAAPETQSKFKPYKAANIAKLSSQYMAYGNFKGLVKAILDIEAPLSEEWLLKRTVYLFDREKVTSVVQRLYEEKMFGCERIGILRRRGFLYLDSTDKAEFRTPGDLTREIKYIAPEELADAMLEIVKQNVTIEKNSLYKFLASKCGFARVSKSAGEYFDEVLESLNDKFSIDGNLISLK